MNSVWEQQRTLDPTHLSTVNTSMGSASRATNEPDSHCQYTRFIVDEPYINFGMKAERERLTPPLHNWRSEESAAVDPDGKPLEMEDEDPELVQSRSSQRDWMNSSFPRQADHPLKLRVNSLLRQRCPDPHVVPTNSEVLDVLPPLPPSQSFITPPEEENGVNKGFLRFLSVLNKGVDLNVLSRIVNDDSDVIASRDEMLMNTEVPIVESNSDVAFTKTCQTTSSGANPLRLNWASSGERKTVSQEPSHNDRRSPPTEEEDTNERGGHTLATTSQSKSPPAKVKKTEDEKKEKAKKDEQQEQLQNILKTLGFSLEADEMSRLADRTQERLYGKKPSGNHGPDCQDQDPHRRGGHSSSSFSISSPSKSVSSSPSPHRDSHKPEQTPHKGRDVQDVYEDKEPQSHQTHPPPAQPTASSHGSIVAQLSQHTLYHNGMHGSPAHFDSTYVQGESLPSKHSLIGLTYPQHAPQHVPFSVAQPHKLNRQSHVHGEWAHLNPDLSMSEGQTGLIKGPRCLTFIQSSAKKTRNKRSKKKKQKIVSKNGVDQRVTKKVGNPRVRKKVGELSVF